MPNTPQSRPRAVSLKWPAFIFVAALTVSCARQTPEGTRATATPPQAAASPVPWATIEAPSQVSVASGTPLPRQPVRTFRGKGIVRLINLEEGWFEIDHEEIAGFMPAMQMEWMVRDKALLKAVSVGDHVDFTLVDDNGDEVVTELKKSPEP